MKTSVKVSVSRSGIYRAQVWINGVCPHGLTASGENRKVACCKLSDNLLGLSRMAKRTAAKQDEV